MHHTLRDRSFNAAIMQSVPQWWVIMPQTVAQISAGRDATCWRYSLCEEIELDEELSILINQSISQSITILSCAEKLTRELANLVCHT